MIFLHKHKVNKANVIFVYFAHQRNSLWSFYSTLSSHHILTSFVCQLSFVTKAKQGNEFKKTSAVWRQSITRTVEYFACVCVKFRFMVGNLIRSRAVKCEHCQFNEVFLILLQTEQRWVQLDCRKNVHSPHEIIFV